MGGRNLQRQKGGILSVIIYREPPPPSCSVTRPFHGERNQGIESRGLPRAGGAVTLSTRAFQAASSVLPMNLSQAPSLFSQHVEAGLDQRVGTQRGQQWARQGERRHRCLVWGLWRLRVPGSLCGSRHSAGSTRVWNLHLDKLPFSPGDCRSLKRLKLL